MRYRDSIFGQLLKPLSRRFLATIAARHQAEAYDKRFRCWDHLVTMVYAQLADVQSLRELEAVWNANSHHHYHLGTGRLARATLADANRRRPIEVFAGMFTKLSAEADRALRQEGAEMVRIIDSSPIPLGEAVSCRAWNGRIKGVKLHVVYEPGKDRRCQIDITPANVNDIEIGKQAVIEKGKTYVFDKAYCSYSWWAVLHANGAFFVTRQKEDARFKTACKRALTEAQKQGDGFTIIDDAEIKLIYNRNTKPILPVRRVRVKRDTGGYLTLITNDLKRPAAEIAKLYKARWQIELLFRWIKQNLNLKTFLGRSENAIKLQLYAAMIAYLLLRLAARASCSKHTPIRFSELVACSLFVRRSMARVDKPPDVNPSKPKSRPISNQMELRYA